MKMYGRSPSRLAEMRFDIFKEGKKLPFNFLKGRILIYY